MVGVGDIACVAVDGADDDGGGRGFVRVVLGF